jgi:histidyl-tRNA synthetase
METLGLFDKVDFAAPPLMFANFGGECYRRSFVLAGEVRACGRAAEVYPEARKLAVQFAYADKRGIKKVAILGPDDLAAGRIQVKDMTTGVQEKFEIERFVSKITDTRP